MNLKLYDKYNEELVDLGYISDVSEVQNLTYAPKSFLLRHYHLPSANKFNETAKHTLVLTYCETVVAALSNSATTTNHSIVSTSTKRQNVHTPYT